jgi:peptide/nickel transport system substrate-binding protein
MESFKPMDSSYWARALPSMVHSRRRALALAGGAVGAAFLIACGQSGKKANTRTSLISSPADTSDRAKRGGVLQLSAGEPNTLDPQASPNSQSSASAGAHYYSRLIKWKPGIGTTPTGEFETDLAESWEISPDKLQLTFKLRSDLKLDPRPPTNGRSIDSGDVGFSAQRIARLSNFRGDLFRSAGPQGPIASVESPDARTVVFKLGQPDNVVLHLIANPRYFAILPKEADGGFDPKLEARGYGPWLLKSLRASTGIEYERNPNWHIKDRPFLDGINGTFLGDYATQLAQFRAKNLWLGDFVRNEDLVPLKTEFRELILVQGEYSKAPNRFFFGTAEANSPFRDERVRQAASMALDRDAIIDAEFSVKQLQQQGLEIESRWNSHLGVGWEPAWLNPQSGDFGPNAKYFKFDLSEAKKLLTAAGHPNGFDYDFHFTSNGYSPAYVRDAEILAGQLQEAGIRAKMLAEDYNSVFIAGSRAEGKFTGARLSVTAPSNGPAEQISTYFLSTGGQGQHMPAFQTEPDVDAAIQKMRQEFDNTKVIQLVHDFQRDMAKRMRNIWQAGSTPSLTMAWPWVGNYGAYRTFNTVATGSDLLTRYWYDETKKT